MNVEQASNEKTMRQTPFLDRNILKHLLNVFVAFLSVLSGLLAVHYPVLPEKVLPLFTADRSQVLNLGEFLSAVAFAVSLVVAVQTRRSDLKQADQSETAGAKRLSSLGLTLLLAASFGCLVHFELVLVSVRVAHAISEAQRREITDRFARDELAELRDPSIGYLEAYRIATEFLEAERLPKAAVEEVLKSAKVPPFQSSVITTYTTTMLCFKLGLFFAAAGLALQLPARKGHKNKKNRVVKRGDVENIFQELTKLE
jgi:hypothetical protein